MAVPSRPMIDPCVMKIATMSRGEPPSVRRMAMSARFSFTTITSVEMMLKAATATTISSTKNMIDFVTWIERKKLPWRRLQSLM